MDKPAEAARRAAEDGKKLCRCTLKRQTLEKHEGRLPLWVNSQNRRVGILRQLRAQDRPVVLRLVSFPPLRLDHAEPCRKSPEAEKGPGLGHELFGQQIVGVQITERYAGGDQFLLQGHCILQNTVCGLGADDVVGGFGDLILHLGEIIFAGCQGLFTRCECGLGGLIRGLSCQEARQQRVCPAMPCRVTNCPAQPASRCRDSAKGPGRFLPVSQAQRRLPTRRRIRSCLGHMESPCRSRMENSVAPPAGPPLPAFPRTMHSPV
jgi:hypothetical protein